MRQLTDEVATAYLCQSADGLSIVYPQPQECPSCHVMHSIFVNRYAGATVCLDCDEKARKRHEETIYERSINDLIRDFEENGP